MIKPEPTEWVLPLHSRNGKYRYGELRVCVNVMAVYEKVEEIKEQYPMTNEELKKQSNKNNLENSVINELQCKVEEQDLKLQQMKGNEEWYGVQEMKQAKISDQEKCKMKLGELEMKHREMLEMKKELEIAVEQKKLKVAELRKAYERKVEQLKLASTSKQNDEKEIEESNQKIVEVVEDMTIQQSVGVQKMVRQCPCDK